MKKSVVICLINPKNEILMQLRDKIPSISYPNFWAMISGGVEKGESELEAIKREVKEEIGVKAEKIEFLDTIIAKKNKYLSDDVKVYIFKGFINIPAEKIELTEGQKVQFFKFEELEGIKIIPCLKEFIFKNKEKIFV